jgi:hypothetical protein
VALEMVALELVALELVAARASLGRFKPHSTT